jgi:hypothetical protein
MGIRVLIKMKMPKMEITTDFTDFERGAGDQLSIRIEAGNRRGIKLRVKPDQSHQ